MCVNVCSLCHLSLDGPIDLYFNVSFSVVPPCVNSYVMCHNEVECVPQDKWCDKDKSYDCSDGSDVHYCESKENVIRECI